MLGNYFKGKRVLLTGASSGIGANLAMHLDQLGADLILGGRSEVKLAEISNGFRNTPRFLVGDLTDPETIASLSQITQTTGLDVAILNAGTNGYIDADQFSADAFWNLMTQNVRSIANCVEVVVPVLLKSGGQLALMSSLAAYGGLPRSSGYGASKAAIRVMAQSLDIDLRPKGVAVTTVCPGFVKTPLTDLNTFPMPFLMSPDAASKAILTGLMHRRHEIHFPLRFSLFMKLIMSLPAPIQHFLVSQGTRHAL
ncbi:SDR family NAD(P)-dependent oxidoreductase [bacterium]|nr:SDR family NAD(P)-dependent oxidoreductase [bacterium]